MGLSLFEDLGLSAKKFYVIASSNVTKFVFGSFYKSALGTEVESNFMSRRCLFIHLEKFQEVFTCRKRSPIGDLPSLRSQGRKVEPEVVRVLKQIGDLSWCEAHASRVSHTRGGNNTHVRLLLTTFLFP